MEFKQSFVESDAPEKYFDYVANTMVWEGDYWPDALGIITE